MFRKVLLFLLLININFVFASSLIVDSESEFNNGLYENTYFENYYDYSVSLEDSYTKLLMHFEDFNDSMKNHNIILNGDTTIDSNEKKFGASSIYLDGNGDYISIADSEDFNFGTNDFTIDFWVKINSNETRNGLFSQWNAGTNNRALSLEYRGDISPNQLRILTSSDGLSYLDSYVDWTTNQNTWNHFALVKQGINYRIYLNGNLILTHSGPSAYFNSNADFLIGDGDFGGGASLEGSIDEFRISKGVARWTSNFVPPNEKYYASYEKTQTSVKLVENYEDTYTKLLMHFEDFNDSTNNHNIILNGDASIGTGYFDNGLELDGDGDYIEVPDSNDFNFGSEDFAIDMWINLKELDGTHILFDQADSGTTGFRAYIDSSVGAGIQLLGPTFNNNQGSASGWSLDTWHHVAIVRSENTWTFYRNGQNILQSSDSSTIGDFSSNLKIGMNDLSGTQHLNGSIDELRISKGVARWTEEFTPPSREYKVDKTKLLLHFDGPDESQTHFYDSSPSKHTLAINGNTKLESSQKKFGESSVYFDGSGDYISIPDSNTDNDFGSEDFTIETWIKRETTGREDIVEKWVSGSNPFSGGYVLQFSGSGCASEGNYLTFYWDYGPTIRCLDSNYEILDTNWHHIAVSKEGNNWRIFVDGILKNTIVHADTIDDSSTTLKIGGNIFDFHGYLDELKITKGEALYTTNFSPNNYQYYNGFNGLYQSQVFDMSSVVNWENISWLSNIYEDIQIDSNTKLLLHFDNGDESTSFIDSSDSQHSITRYGNTKQENTQTKFGITSGYFDGTGDYLSIPYSSDWDIADTDFTIDFWIYPDDTSASANYHIARVTEGVSWTSGWDIFQRIGTSDIWFGGRPGGSFVVARDLIDDWNHIAFVKKGDSIMAFTNGILKHTVDYSASTFSVPSQPLIIGLNFGGGQGDMKGYLDEFRIVKNKAIWTSNFTPPDQEYQKYKTKLLLHFNQGDESTTFKDSSHYNKTVTAYGNVKQENSSKRFGNSSAYFDGTGDYLTLEDSNDWNFGSSDFTVDVWVRPTAAIQPYIPILGYWQDSANWGGILIDSGNPSIFIKLANSNIITVKNSSYFIPQNQWTHLAYVRKNNNFYIFANGKQIMFQTDVDPIPNYNSLNYIGFADYTDVYYTGFMDELRVTKDKAIWTSDFEPPNQEYYSSLNNIEMKVRTCSNTDCSDGTWTTDISSTSSRYIQFQALFGTQDISYNPELFNVTLNYQGSSSAENNLTFVNDQSYSHSTGTLTNLTWKNNTLKINPSNELTSFEIISDSEDSHLYNLNNNILDSSGNGRDASCTLCPTYSSGKFSQGLTFNGSTYLKIPGFNTLNGHTTMFWVKTTNSDSTSEYSGDAAATIIGDERGSVGNSIGVHDGKVRYSFWISGSIWDSINSTINVNDGQWHHIVVSHATNDEAKIYINGKLDNSKLIDFSTTALGYAFDTIGKGYQNNYFTGELDDISVWDKVLTDEEVNQTYIKEPKYKTGEYLSQIFDLGGEFYVNNISYTSSTPNNIPSNYFGDGSDGDILVNSTGIYQSFNDGLSYSIVPGTTVNKWPCEEDGDMVVINAKNFIVESGGSFGPYNRTRGLMIYATGNLFVNGTITVANRGAKANPDETSVTSYTPNPSTDGNAVPTEGLVIRREKSDWTDIDANIISNAKASSINDFRGSHNSSNLFFGAGLPAVNSEANQINVTNGLVIKIPKVGASGGSGSGYTTPGNKLFATAGGGGSSNGYSGSAGTCFSGGSGAGSGQNGLPYGGKGGDHAFDGGVSKGGGAGNPAGDYFASGSPGSGTGGVLLIFAKEDISLKQNALLAYGTSGGNCYGDYCGGGSGGGVISTLYGGNFINLDSRPFYSTYTYNYASLSTNYGSDGIFNTLGGRWGVPGGSLEGTTPYVGEYGGTGAIIGPIKINGEANLTTLLYFRTSNDNSSWSSWTEYNNDNINTRYLQYKIEFTGEIGYSPNVTQVNINYIETLPTQYFASPTPENESNLMVDEVLINVSSVNSLSNCILHINSQNILMTNYGTYCTQNFSIFNSQIEIFNYNVTFTENSQNKITENRMFTYYPDYSQEALPSQGLISGLITILIIIGGLFL